MKMHYKVIIACTVACACIACLNIVNSARLSNSHDSRRRSLDRLARRDSVLANMAEPMAHFAPQYLDFVNLFSPNDFLLDYYQDYIDVKPEEDREYDGGMCDLAKTFLESLGSSADGSGFENLLSKNFGDLFSKSTGKEMERASFPKDLLGITPQESQLLLPVAKFNMFSLLDGPGMFSSMQKSGTMTILDDPDNQKFTYETDEDVAKAETIEGLNIILRILGYPGLAGPKSDVEIYDFLATAVADNTNPIGTATSVEGLGSVFSTNGFPLNLLTKLQDAQSSGNPIVYEPLLDSYKLKAVPKLDSNSELVDSPWPCTYQNTTAQSSTVALGPTVFSNLSLTKLNKSMIVNNPIELIYGLPDVTTGKNEYKHIWGSSWTSVFKLKRTATEFELAGYIEKETEDIFDDKFHGKYSLMTADGRYIVCANKSIIVYKDHATEADKIVKADHTYTIATNTIDTKPPYDDAIPVQEDEVIKGISMLENGEIVWVGSKGRVGVISNTVGNVAGETLAWTMLGSKAKDENIDVYNGIAISAKGRIIIVSNKYVHILTYVPAGTGVEAQLNIDYETAYDEHVNENADSDESPRGSRSSPTFMGTDANEYVVIVDSAPVSNLVVISVSTGAVVARKPITFGHAKPENTLVNHSLLVSGWRIAVVNSTATSQTMGASIGIGNLNLNMAGVMKSGKPALSLVNEISNSENPNERLNINLTRNISHAGTVDPYDMIREPGNIVHKMRLFGESEKGLLRAIGAQFDMHNMKEMGMKMPTPKPLSNFLASMTNNNNGLFSEVFNTTPFGVEQFEFNVASNELSTKWVNTDVSLPNGTPTLSSSLGIMYGIGKRNPFKRESGPLGGTWTLEAINWDTGKSIFSYSLGGGPWTNTAYGSTQIGPNSEIVAATANGIIRIIPTDITKQARQFNKA